MASLNKALIIGNLGADPAVRYAPSGDAVANFSIATSERYTDKAGEKKETTEWHKCVAFGKRAETLAEYAKKGSQLYVEGKIQTRKWTDKEGVERYSTEIVVENFQFLGAKGDAKPADAGASDYAKASGAEGAKRAAAPKQTAKAGSFDDLEDDIPF